MKKHIEKVPVFVWFLLISITAFWQVALLQNCLLWDMIDCYVPWRTFVGECIQNKILPFWNPYQACGYPIYGDLRSALGPEMWLIGITTGYSYYTLHALFILYVSLAGTGMYYLLRHLQVSKPLSIAIGAAYLMSGFVISQSQEISALAGAAWFPWIIYHYLNLIKSGKTRYLFYAAFFLYLCIYGAYPAITIALNYLLFAFFIVQLVRLIKLGSKKQVATWLLQNTALYALVALTAVALAVTFTQMAPFIERFSGLEYAQTTVHSFNPKAFLSMLLPFATVQSNEFFQLDASMRNLYIGLIPLIFIPLGLLRPSVKYQAVFIGTVIFSLLMILGHFTPFHECFVHLPLMNMFRSPSFFRLPLTFSLLVLAAWGIEQMVSNTNYRRKTIHVFLLATYLILIAAIGYALYRITHLETALFNQPGSLAKKLEQSVAFHILFQASIQLGLLLLFWWAWKKRSKHLRGLVAVLIIADMIMATQLQMYYTVVNPTTSARRVQTYLKQQPSGFPIPELAPVIQNTDMGSMPSPYWCNTNTLQKRISFDTFNSFKLSGYRKDALRTTPLQNPPIYITPNCETLDTAQKVFDEHSVYLTENSCVENNLVATDSLTAKVQLEHFTPLTMSGTISAPISAWLVILQYHMPQWQLYIDDKNTPIETANRMYMAAPIAPGSHHFKLEYKNAALINALVITLLSGLLIGIICLIFAFRNSHKRSVKIIVILSIVLLLGSIVRYIQLPTYEQKLQNQLSEFAKWVQPLAYTHVSDSIDWWIETNNPVHGIPDVHIAPDSRHVYTYHQAGRVDSLSKLILASTKPYFGCFIQNRSMADEIIPAVEQVFGQQVQFKKIGEGFAAVFYRKPLNESTKQIRWAVSTPERVRFSQNKPENRVPVCKIDSVTEFIGLPVSVDGWPDLNKSNRVHFVFRIVPTDYRKVHLVIEETNYLGSVKYSYYSLSTQSDLNKPVIRSLTHVLNRSYLGSSKIKAYIWNQGKSILTIDQLTVYSAN